MATRQLTTKQVVNLASDPVSGTAGEIYYNTASNTFKYYNGISWVAFSSGGGGDSLPSQTGNAGNYLTTNGTTASWASITEDVQDIVGGMVSGNTESGISVTYDDTNGKLDFNVNDPTITLTGDITGSATMTDLGNVSISTTIAANSVELGTDTTGQYIASVSGTTNQVNVSGSGTESITLTLSTPQDIHSGASPTFAGATLDAIRVGITAANEIDTTTGNLTIDSAGGTVTIDDNLTVSGNLTVNGTTTTVNSTTLTVDDPIITLGGDTILSTDDGKDRGIEFRYYDTESRLGFMGYNDSTGEFTLLINATNTNEVFSGTKATINAHISGSNINAGTVSATYIDGAIARLASPTFTGTPSAPTAAADTNTTQIATTAYVIGQASSVSPAALGTVAVGTSNRYARADHVHPTTGLGLTSGKLSQFASTTSAELAEVISDETGSGALVFGTSPAITTSITTPSTSFDLINTTATTINFGAAATILNVGGASTRIKLTAGSILEAPVSTNAQTGITYDLVLSDAGKLIEMNNGSANTINVPTNSSQPFPIGTKIDIVQTGTGQTSIAAAGGVTLNSSNGSLSLSGQWSAATLVKRATDTWILIGGLA